MKPGLGGVMPPVVTPFKEDESLDLPSFRANFSRWNQTGLSGYLVLGSNGENLYLNEKEKEQVMAAAREAVPQDRVLMIGAGAESTRETIAQCRLAAQHGADCALIITPFYYKSQMTPERLSGHFRAVADAAPLPILIYNFPQCTGINIDPQTVAALAGHQNIAGIKDSSGNIAQMSELTRLCPDGFAVFSGNAPTFFSALTLGAAGGILAVANTAPEICLQIQELFSSGQYEQALEKQRLVTPLSVMVTQQYGIGGLKLAMGLAGYDPGFVRSPLAIPAQPEIKQALKDELTKVGL